MSISTTDQLIKRALELHPRLKQSEAAIKSVYKILHNCFSSGHKLLVCGNGGSAADAEHIVTELMNRFSFHRALDNSKKETLRAAGLEKNLVDNLQPALRAISLSSQSGLMTAISNDLGYSLVYAQQVIGYGDAGDVLLAISTSGNSANIINAVKVAKSQEMMTVALTGKTGGQLVTLVDEAIRVDSDVTFEIQELHLPTYHLLCSMLEVAFFDEVG